MKRVVVVLWLINGMLQVPADAAPAPAKPSEPPADPPVASAPLCPAGAAERILDWCNQKKLNAVAPVDDAVLLCIDASSGCFGGIIEPTRDKPLDLLPPNRVIVVAVHAASSDKVEDVSVALGGGAGQSLPAVQTGLSTKSDGQGVALLEKVIEPPGPPYYLSRFAPRTPGAVQLTVTITKRPAAAMDALDWVGDKDGKDKDGKDKDGKDKDGKDKDGKDKDSKTPGRSDGSQPSDRGPTCTAVFCNVVEAAPPPAKSDDGSKRKKTYAYELYVPQIYGGALRLGIGAVRVHGLEHSYGMRKVAGSDFSQVVDNGADPVNMEIVVGYAPFLGAKLTSDMGGRTYMRGDNPWTRFAPYFGVGIISSSNSKLEWLRSLYAGVEYELTPGSSLALALVVRRVDALANGLSVGMPVADTTNLTRVTYEAGVGVVFNFTPAFFQFATSAIPK